MAPRRRWFTTHFIHPQADLSRPDTLNPLPLSLWNDADDTFEHADQGILDQLAHWAGRTSQEFMQQLRLRTDCLTELAQGSGANMEQMYEGIATFRKRNG